MHVDTVKSADLKNIIELDGTLTPGLFRIVPRRFSAETVAGSLRIKMDTVSLAIGFEY